MQKFGSREKFLKTKTGQVKLKTSIFYSNSHQNRGGVEKVDSQ